MTSYLESQLSLTFPCKIRKAWGWVTWFASGDTNSLFVEGQETEPGSRWDSAHHAFLTRSLYDGVALDWFHSLSLSKSSIAKS